MTSRDEFRKSGTSAIAQRKSGDSSFALRSLIVWIWFCAGLNLAGWGLSAVKELNAGGYIVVLLIGVAVFFIWRQFGPGITLPDGRGSVARFRKWFRRFKRPFPLGFLILSVMAFVGGAIYAPTNYDGLAYRLPRVLHWLAADQWQWIHTGFPRVNNRGSGIEWVSAPLMAIFKTDRLLFLTNFIPFLFLPGLTFAVLSRLGVRRRVAWCWMWIAPSGYCFLLQAASISNDAFGAPFALAAIFFALRARESGRACDVFNSILSAALTSGVKTSNLPLLLPCALAILPSLKILFRRPIATIAVCVLAGFASFLPNAIANQHYCHDWSGRSMEGDQTHGSLAIRLGVNTAYLCFVNLLPPVFPEANQWNSFVQRVIPPHLMNKLRESFTEPGAPEFLAAQMQVEEDAGFGFGATLLLAMSAIAAAVSRRGSFFQFRFDSMDGLFETGLVLSPWVVTFALLSQSEVSPIGRILAPYYILMLPLLLRCPGHEQLVKKIWWRVSAFFVFVLAAGLLIVSPGRPLFPVGALLARLEAGHSNSKLASRIEEVYSVYRDRNHAFAPALADLPPGTKTLGFITYDDPETSLWQPYGSRRIVYVKPSDTADGLKSQGVQYILARSDLFNLQFPGYFPHVDDWAKKMDAELIQKIPLNLRAGTGPVEWYLFRLN